MIAKHDLKHGHYYTGYCRNTRLARWDAVRELFVYWEVSFGVRALCTIVHYENRGMYDYFEPESEERQPVEYIPLED